MLLQLRDDRFGENRFQLCRHARQDVQCGGLVAQPDAWSRPDGVMQRLSTLGQSRHLEASRLWSSLRHKALSEKCIVMLLNHGGGTCIQRQRQAKRAS